MSAKKILLSSIILVMIQITAWSKDLDNSKSVVQTFDLKQTQEKVHFNTQVLEPFGGKILMPESWFYRERHGESSYVWILSKEDPDNGPYITGVKIQYLSGIEAGTGKSPELFLRQFVSEKKNQVKVLSECGAEDQGFFTRICLETLEPATELGSDISYHIRYSLYWGNDMDMAIVMIQGTLDDIWEENSDIFSAMNEFEMIDMTRFE